MFIFNMIISWWIRIRLLHYDIYMEIIGTNKINNKNYYDQKKKERKNYFSSKLFIQKVPITFCTKWYFSSRSKFGTTCKHLLFSLTQLFNLFLFSLFSLVTPLFDFVSFIVLPFCVVKYNSKVIKVTTYLILEFSFNLFHFICNCRFYFSFYYYV